MDLRISRQRARLSHPEMFQNSLMVATVRRPQSTSWSNTTPRGTATGGSTTTADSPPETRQITHRTRGAILRLSTNPTPGGAEKAATVEPLAHNADHRIPTPTRGAGRPAQNDDLIIVSGTGRAARSQ